MYIVDANAALSSQEHDRWHTTTQEAFMNRGQMLVVDDDPNIRLLLAASLEFEGFELQTAPDDSTALELCATRTFALFLIDYAAGDGWPGPCTRHPGPAPGAPNCADHWQCALGF